MSLQQEIELPVWLPQEANDLRKYLLDNLCNGDGATSESYPPLKPSYNEAVDISNFVEPHGDIVGSGGFGDVYKGRWKNVTDEMRSRLPTIAIKVIRAVVLLNPDERKARMKKLVEREVRVWNACAHKNVLPLIGFARLQGDYNLPALITFWMVNGNVRDYLQANRNAPKLTIITEMAEGLSYLHGCGIVHGDIKAVNVLVDLQGHSYLCDFGLSRMNEDITLWNTTATHAAGSMRWMSPELLLANEKLVTVASDMYAYGMTCFVGLTSTSIMACLTSLKEILSGQIPFESLKNDAAVIVAVVMHNAKPEREIIAEAPEDMWRILVDCWRTEPATRPSALEVLRTLNSFTMPLPQSVNDAISNRSDAADRPYVSNTPNHHILPVSCYQERATLSIEASATCMAFSPDSTRLVTGHLDDFIRVWDLVTERLILGPLSGHSDGVTSMEYLPDGSKFVSGSWDRTIRIWDATDGTCTLGPLEGHTGRIGSMVCSPNSVWLASCTQHKSDLVRLWNLSDGSQMGTLGKPQQDVHGFEGLAISRDGSSLAGTDSWMICIWDIPSMSIRHCFDMPATSLTISPVRDILATGDKTGAIRFSEFDGGRAVGIFDAPQLPPEGEPDAIRFSSDGRLIVSGHGSGEIRIWDYEAGRNVELQYQYNPITRRHQHSNAVSRIAFAPDGLSFASCCRDKRVRVWDSVK